MNWTEFFVLKRQPPSMVRIGVLGVLYDVHKLDPMLNMKHCKLFMLKTMLVKRTISQVPERSLRDTFCTSNFLMPTDQQNHIFVFETITL